VLTCLPYLKANKVSPFQYESLVYTSILCCLKDYKGLGSSNVDWSEGKAMVPTGIRYLAAFLSFSIGKKEFVDYDEDEDENENEDEDEDENKNENVESKAAKRKSAVSTFQHPGKDDVLMFVSQLTSPSSTIRFGARMFLSAVDTSSYSDDVQEAVSAILHDRGISSMKVTEQVSEL